MTTTIYCVYNGTDITVVYGADIAQCEWITVPAGYTSMPSSDARYSAWYDALTDSQKTVAVAPGS